MRSLVALTAAVAFVLVACESENRPIPGAGDGGNPPTNNAKEPLEGGLPKPLGTVTAAEFRTAVMNIPSWRGGATAKRCTDAPLCGLSFSKVPVTIEPAFDAVNANFANVGVNGTILLRMKNVGGRRTTRNFAGYELEPGVFYYVVVSSADGQTGRWDLLPFDLANPKDPGTSSQYGPFHDCDHYQKRRWSKAGFYTCADAQKQPDEKPASLQKASLAVFGMAGLSTLAHVAVAAFSLFDQATGWVSCAFGCCTLVSM
jgi:hypothetical protein